MSVEKITMCLLLGFKEVGEFHSFGAGLIGDI